MKAIITWTYNEKTDLENLIFTEYTKGKRDIGRQRATYLRSLFELIVEQGEWKVLSLSKERKTAKDHKGWKFLRDMITHILKGSNT